MTAAGIIMKKRPVTEDTGYTEENKRRVFIEVTQPVNSPNAATFSVTSAGGIRDFKIIARPFSNMRRLLLFAGTGRE